MNQNAAMVLAARLEALGFRCRMVEAKLGDYWLVAVVTSDLGYLVKHEDDADELIATGRVN